MDPAAYIRREMTVSIGINTALSALFFLLAFGRSGSVAVWGQGGYVPDFAVQGFMIGLMSVLMPGLLARKARMVGKIDGLTLSSRPFPSLATRAISWALAGASVGAAGSAALFWFAGVAQFAWTPALLAKLGFGALWASVATTASLRAELNQ